MVSPELGPRGGGFTTKGGGGWSICAQSTIALAMANERCEARTSWSGYSNEPRRFPFDASR